ncbi:MAG: hypothetical protein PGMFKBFP_03114 [Anaerolineales bacterium]|nr:hypothetical protein [Anaerolineales bacterium]
MLFAEQLLASDLGAKVESQEQPQKINLVRLEELFRPVLYKESIDERWKTERKIEQFIESKSGYLAVTQNENFCIWFQG